MAARVASGWAYIVIGAVAGVVLLPVAAVATLVAAGRPSVAVVSAALAVLLVLSVVGSLPAVRRGMTRLANTLLRTDLPALDKTAPAAWMSRLRSGAWAALHVAVGTAVVTLTGFLLVIAVVLPATWLLGGDNGVVYFGAPLSIRPGWRGSWTVAAAAAHMAAAWFLGLGALSAGRRLAPLLLGPTTAERLVATQRRADLLAHRNALARELHDSIGHTLNASVVHAAVAGRYIDSDPQRARQAMLHVEETSRAALADLDHMLGVLRDQPATPPPARDLSALPELLTRLRESGTLIQMDVMGDLGRLPASTSRETYRIVQEGFTNVLRHAPGAPVEVTLQVTRRHLVLRITNPVDGRPTSASRRGLIGIAERVRILGGDVDAGPGPAQPAVPAGDYSPGCRCLRRTKRLHEWRQRVRAAG